MFKKIKEILKLYKNWFFSIIKILVFICMMIFLLIVMVLSAPFITSTTVQTVLKNMFDKITGVMYWCDKRLNVG